MNNEDKKNGVNKSVINWYPGHMVKAKREIKEKIDLIDVVFEIVDARIPKSSKNKDIEDIIKVKPRVMIMTKKDLCDSNETNKWVNYYEKLGYKVILMDLVNNPNMKIVMNSIQDIINDFNEKRKKKGLTERRIRALVIGIPNVGKSTFINRLVGKKATNVGNKPGITKQLEWIRVNKDIELLDTPGILWPKLDDNDVALNLAAMTAIKEEILPVDDVAIYIINKMFKLYPNAIMKRYNLTNNDDIVETLDNIGKKIGAKRNSEVDYDKVYKVVLKDLRDGYLGQVTFDRYKEN